MICQVVKLINCRGLRIKLIIMKELHHSCLVLFGFFYVAFNTVQVISRRVVGRAEETST